MDMLMNMLMMADICPYMDMLMDMLMNMLMQVVQSAWQRLRGEEARLYKPHFQCGDPAVLAAVLWHS